MLRSLIRQLSASPLSSTISKLQQDHKQRGSQPSLNELATCLHDTIDSVDGDVFIILDALDEYHLEDRIFERSKLLEIIENLIHRHRNLHLLISSRPEPDISAVLRETAQLGFDIEAYMKDDITRYIDNALGQTIWSEWGQDIISQIRGKLLSFEEM